MTDTMPGGLKTPSGEVIPEELDPESEESLDPLPPLDVGAAALPPINDPPPPDDDICGQAGERNKRSANKNKGKNRLCDNRSLTSIIPFLVQSLLSTIIALAVPHTDHFFQNDKDS
jgi:hypothetical protein